MIAPTINAERLAKCPPIWRSSSLQDVVDMITFDVAELRRLYSLQAQDAVDAAEKARQPDYRLRTQIKAWERTQDVHWSWYKEMLNASTGATEGSTGLGSATVGQGH